MKKIVTIFALVASTLISVTTMAQEKKEIFNADPTMFVDNGKYYLTGTRNREPIGFNLLESTDLKSWKTASGDSLQLILKHDPIPASYKGFWAPQIFKDGDTYYLTYSANEQTRIASAKSIYGPFVHQDDEMIDSGQKNIDSFIFKDEDGKYYIYYVRFDKGNYIWSAEFDLDGGFVKTNTLKRCFVASQPWERTKNYKSNPVMEGPTVMKIEDTYYLFYSTNHFRNIDYAMGYATAPTPQGPWTKNENNPVIHRDIVGENGSGHGDLIKGLDGVYYYVYHIHHSKTQITPRRVRIVPLKFEKNANGIYDITAEADKVIVPTYSCN